MPSAFATPALLLLVDLLLDDHTEVDRELGLAHADHIASKQTRLTQTCRHPGFPTHAHQLAEGTRSAIHDAAHAHARARACAPPPVAR